MARYVAHWFEAFLFTQLVEIPIYCTLLGVTRWRAFVASTLTHPLVWFVFAAPWTPGSMAAKIAVAELFAFVAEGFYFLWLVGGKKVWVASLVANGASFSLGYVARVYLGWHA